MELTIILTTIIANFATNPDLCADVYLDETGQPLTDALGQTFSRYCEWTGPDAPVLESDACCTIDHDGAHCSVPDERGRCSIGMKMSCEYGEVIGDAVTCYQPFPSTCDMGQCSDSGDVPLEIGAQPVEGAVLCCIGGVCFPVATAEDVDTCWGNNGYATWCKHGFQNADGTVDCYD